MSILLPLVFLALCALRASAPRGIRLTWSVGWLGLGVAGNIILYGYAPTQISTSLGDLNAVWTWGCVVLALIEGFLAVERNRLGKQATKFLLAYFFFYLLILLAAFFSGLELTLSSLYLIAFFMLILFLGPKNENLDGLRFVGLISMFFIYYLLLTDYNPMQYSTLGKPIAGMSAPEYRNFVWDIFGLQDRFHGPFSHPNQLGMYSAFFSTALATSEKRWYRFFSLGFVILTFCAASRTSMIVALIGQLLLQSYKIWGKSMKKQKRFYGYFLLFGVGSVLFVGFQFGSGRSSLFLESFKKYPIEVIFGTPSFTIENSFLINLFQLGLIGFLLVFYLHFIPLKIFWNSNLRAAGIGIVFTIQLIIASSSEAVVYGSILNPGSLYLLILVILLNSIPDYIDSKAGQKK